MRPEHLCDHGTDATRHTLAGEPLCPLCRLPYRRTTHALANIRPPAYDYAALAAHDLQENDP